MDDEDAVVEHRIKNVWDQLKRGSFVASKFPGDPRLATRIAEVREVDAVRRRVTLHHMLDIRHPTKFSSKKLGDRILAYEFFDEKAGRSVIDEKLVHKDSSSKDYTPPMVDVYGPDDLEIRHPCFNLWNGKRIPADVVSKIENSMA